MRAVRQEVEVFQHDGADQGRFASRFHDGRKRAVAADQLDVNAFGLAALGPAAVGVMLGSSCIPSLAEAR